jgi:hypothetical protein
VEDRIIVLQCSRIAAMWRKILLGFTLLPALTACETEDVCDGVDNDGDGYYDEDHERDEVIRPFYVDADGDGFGDVDFVVTPPIWACAAPEEMVDNNLDCDDADATIQPDADEDCADGVDNDCDGLMDGADEACGGGDDDDDTTGDDDDSAVGDDDDSAPGDDDDSAPGDDDDDSSAGDDDDSAGAE